MARWTRGLFAGRSSSNSSAENGWWSTSTSPHPCNKTRTSIGADKKVCGHARAYGNHKPAHPGSRQAQRKTRTEVAAQCRTEDHHQRLRPVHRVPHNKNNYCNAISGAAQYGLEGVHLVNVGHAESGQHGQDHESHAPAEVATVDRYQ